MLLNVLRRLLRFILAEPTNSRSKSIKLYNNGSSQHGDSRFLYKVRERIDYNCQQHKYQFCPNSFGIAKVCKIIGNQQCRRKSYDWKKRRGLAVKTDKEWQRYGYRQNLHLQYSLYKLAGRTSQRISRGSYQKIKEINGHKESGQHQLMLQKMEIRYTIPIL